MTDEDEAGDGGWPWPNPLPHREGCETRVSRYGVYFVKVDADYHAALRADGAEMG